MISIIRNSLDDKVKLQEFNSIIANNDGNIEALFENLNKFLEN